MLVIHGDRGEGERVVSTARWRLNNLEWEWERGKGDCDVNVLKVTSEIRVWKIKKVWYTHLGFFFFFFKSYNINICIQVGYGAGKTNTHTCTEPNMGGIFKTHPSHLFYGSCKTCLIRVGYPRPIFAIPTHNLQLTLQDSFLTINKRYLCLILWDCTTLLNYL